MNAFLTGSHIYGTPHEDSDIDLVVMMPVSQLGRLNELIAEDADSEMRYEGMKPGACVRFGKLNLIVVTDQDDYRAWQEGTAELTARKPVTRDEAKAVFHAKREANRKARENILAELVNDEPATPPKADFSKWADAVGFGEFNPA
ncbi:nucleotidyltransferase domain-containing protein [Singulisphaera sp. Ch08]|uniref:Nucleotidyltransferase domain-containing protein n=1 Tax=Singulisphaera sp. Ch08 TaxID=3120278 RepID=A0AAU7CJQ3_9BACT